MQPPVERIAIAEERVAGLSHEVHGLATKVHELTVSVAELAKSVAVLAERVSHLGVMQAQAMPQVRPASVQPSDLQRPLLIAGTAGGSLGAAIVTILKALGLA